VLTWREPHADPRHGTSAFWYLSGKPATQHNEHVLDGRLVGYWSDGPLYQGAMEAADIAFRADGTGWTYWSRDAGTFFVQRFSWHSAAGGHLTLDLHEELSGTWEVAGHTTQHHVGSRGACDQQIVLVYEITAGQNVFRKPATLLKLDQPIRLGTIGDRFALERDLAEGERDPAISSPWKPSSIT
jgi:hypothetical protein